MKKMTVQVPNGQAKVRILHLPESCLAVLVITHHGMSQMLKMNSNLVGAPGMAG